MMLRVLLPVAVLCVLVGCSKSEQKAASSPAAAARPEYNSLSDVPAELRSELESFARKLAADFRSGDSNAVRRAFDSAAIAEGICEGVQGPQKSLSQFKNGLQEGVGRSSGRLVQQWSDGDAKYKGLVLYKGSPAARFRFAGESGVALVDLALRKSSQGKVRVVNLCNHAMGYDMVEQTRQMVAPMLADMDKGFLARLVNKPNISPGDTKRLGDMAKQFASQDYAGVVSTYQGLPPALKESMAPSMMHINALQNLNDDDKYKQALKEAGKRFNSASFQFMLVDVYYLDKEYDKATECIDNFMQRLEKDAALLALKSLMLNAKGDIKGAQSVLSEAFKLEPDCLFAHSKGLDVLLAAKDFAGVRDSMVFLEQKGGYAFKDAMDDPLWDEFKKAPESARWR
jgi:tetratricopeptide (TPR) repeat protein